MQILHDEGGKQEKLAANGCANSKVRGRDQIFCKNTRSRKHFFFFFGFLVSIRKDFCVCNPDS